MKMQNKRIFASVLLFVLISFVCVAYGQPEETPPPPGAPTPPGFPIDGGILAGVIVALFYGVRKFIKHNKQ